MVPPPLMQHGSIGANNTVINAIYPQVGRPLVVVRQCESASTRSSYRLSYVSSRGGREAQKEAVSLASSHTDPSKSRTTPPPPSATELVPLIKASNRLDGVVDTFSVMGGRTDWASAFPASCALDSPWAPCGYFCDAQSCDQCHPNDDGYAHLARAVQAGLGFL
jgi:hypothetical protein